MPHGKKLGKGIKVFVMAYHKWVQCSSKALPLGCLNERGGREYSTILLFLKSIIF